MVISTGTHVTVAAPQRWLAVSQVKPVKPVEATAKDPEVAAGSRLAAG